MASVSVFASFFWLWSIVVLLALVFLYSFGALMDFAGFMTPLKSAGRALDRASLRVRWALLGASIMLLAYPSFVHRLWADATADGMRNAFRELASFPESGQPEPFEHLGGLYDPAGSQGAYILAWFGTTRSRSEVEGYYRRGLVQHGWVEEESADPQAVRFWDASSGETARYELLVAVASPRDPGVPAALASDPTVFAVRLGAVDPRVTNQVSWFIDCLVRWAPTLPSCEAGPWHPLNAVLRPAGSRSAPSPNLRP